jgi:triacylglycerol esterase/lipase EstA (alpha/beta hydrolase family)
VTAPRARIALGLRSVAVCAVALSSMLGLGGIGASLASAQSYAPLDAPGPALEVPKAKLREALKCYGDLARAKRAPILLVPGTGTVPEHLYGWNYMRVLDALRWPYCTVTLPDAATNEIQTASEYAVYAIRTMFRAARRKVAPIGASQGGIEPRWALRFWPDTRAMVDDNVGLSPTNHGSLVANALCARPCSPANWQQTYQSNLIRALNSYQETFGGISYTQVYTQDR